MKTILMAAVAITLALTPALAKSGHSGGSSSTSGAGAFAASLSATIASANEAIAYQWHSNWRRPGYQYREDHKERDDLVYAIRGNWAIADGYMKAGPNGYSDEITQPSQEIFCSCSATYIYTLASLPDDMLTAKGRTLLASPKH